MKLLSLAVFVVSAFALNLSAHAKLYKSEGYVDYTMIADNEDIHFRFVGEGEYSVCATGVKFAEKLLKIQDGARHREYLLQAFTKETGDSGVCTPGAPIVLSVTLQPMESKWYKLPANNSTTVIVPAWVSIEVK